MDPPAAGLDNTHQSNDGGRVKKPRKRRKPGGCIPCARKRQKCDRSHPCSSCVEKGTPQLCKWDTIADTSGPVRFASSPSHIEVDLTTESADDADDNEEGASPGFRNAKFGFNENTEALRNLTKRVQNIESRVVGVASIPAASRKGPGAMDPTGSGAGPSTGTRIGNFGANPAMNTGNYEYTNFVPMLVGSNAQGFLNETSPSDTSGSRTSPSAQSSQTWAPVRPQAPRRLSEAGFKAPAAQDDSYDRIALFSLVHRGEFIGPGNVLHALHSIQSSSPLRLPSAKTLALTSVPPPHPSKFAQSLIPCPEVQHLVQYIPCAQSGHFMVDAFFKEVNWRYGIHKKWFSNTCSQMWTHLQNPAQGHQLNLHWLCLFFSVLACTPQPGESLILDAKPLNTHDSGTYFICASVARRLAEDHYLDQPVVSLDPNTVLSSPVDGCVLTCLAIPLLCDFLAERGRLSEAWKLAGSGVRIAQSVGMHRDPGGSLWQDMSEEEKDMRRRAWWGLFVWDRLYSHTLSRPQMVRGDIGDVARPGSSDGGGRKNSFLMGRSVMIQLAELVGEILDKCVGVEWPTRADITEMDSKFQTWQSSVPAEFRPGTTPEQDIVLFVGLSPAEIQNFSRQRYMITTWYRLTRLKIYTLALKLQSPSSPRPAGSLDSMQPTAENCIRHALELIKFQCDTFESMRRAGFGERPVGGNWYFEGCLSLFEAAVALVLVLTKFPTVFLASPGADRIEESKKGLKLDYEELTRVLSRAVGVFSEVLKTEEPGGGAAREGGKRAEIAARALEALRGLLKEHWWKLNPRRSGGIPTSSSPAGSFPGSSPPMPEPSPATTESDSMASAMASMMPMQQQQTYTSVAPLVEPLPSFQTFPSLTTTVESQTVQAVLQQQVNYRTYSDAYGNVPQYMTSSYPSSASTSYSSYGTQVPPSTSMGELAQSTSAESFTSATSTTHPQRVPQVSPQSAVSLSSSHLTADGLLPYATEYPFTAPSVPPQQYQYIPQRFLPPPQVPSFPASNPMQSFPSATTAAARAYAYTPTSSATPVYPTSRPAQAGQGMRMIHYVAPGSAAGSASNTTSPAAEPRPSSSDSSNQQPSTTMPDFPPGLYYKQ